jgi:hypothetical protein
MPGKKKVDTESVEPYYEASITPEKKPTPKLPEGVEYNELKNKYRAVLDERHSLWLDTAVQASQCYKLAHVNRTFWALVFLETNK